MKKILSMCYNFTVNQGRNKMPFLVLFVSLLMGISGQISLSAQTVSLNIKVDQFGYPTNARKIAVVSNPINGYNNSQTFTPGLIYQVLKTNDNSVVFTGMPAAWKGGKLHAQSGDKVWWYDFSNVTTPGSYYILDVTNNVKSYNFDIGDAVYNDVMKAAVRMFYYQRSGVAKPATYTGA